MKISIKNLVQFAVLFLLSIQLSSAQTTIKGLVSDNLDNPLPYANVVLLDARDSMLIKGTVSDETGNFVINNIDHKEMILQALMVGFQTTTRSITVNNEQVLSYDITLEEESYELDEVVIKAQKPLYEKQADRTVVNVQSSVTAASKSVLEVLARSPGVIVNQHNNSISMFGKNGVGVMINGKLSQLPVEAVVQMLNGMNAANVEKIELITTPPVKYDAAGIGGIINIITKKSPDLGTNGNISLTGGWNQGKTLGGNITLNHRAEKFNYFLEYSIRTDDNEQLWMENRTIYRSDFNQTISLEQNRVFNVTEQFLRGGFSYNLNKKTTINLMATGHKRNWNMDAVTNNINRVSSDSTVYTTLDFYENNIWKDVMAGVGINHRINDHQALELQFDYVQYVNDNPSGYHLYTRVNNGNEHETQLDVSKDTPLNFKVTKVDYNNQLNDELQLQLGAKASFSALNNDVVVTDLENGQWVVNQRFTSFSDLSEDVWAGYISLDWKISDKSKLYVGGRYEFTDTYLSKGEVKGLVDREYGNFFPSMTISNQIGERSSLSLAYSRRISRPSFNQIAPFVLFSGPNTFFAGNPGLFPAVTDGIDLSYQLKSWWISAKFYTTDKSIQQFQPETDPATGEQIYRSQNMDYLNTWVVTSSLPHSLKSWWKIHTDVTLNYQSFKTHDGFTNKGFSWYANQSHTFTMPKGFIIELSGYYVSRDFSGLWETQPYGQVDIGIKKSFKNSNLTLSFVDVFDTFRPYELEGKILQGQGVSTFSLDPNTRSVNLTFSTTIGNNELKSVNVKSGSEEERRRVN